MNLLVKGLKLLCSEDQMIGRLIENRIPELSLSLEKYMGEIERFNPIYKLVKIATREELIIKHILDSLAPLGYFGRLLGLLGAPESDEANIIAKIADAGAGAGLPGIPLALCLPGAQISLIEKKKRRAGFLQNACALLKLSQVQVEESEIKNVLGRFHLILFRALGPLSPEFVLSLVRLLKPGGTIAAYKGRMETARAELDGLIGLSGYKTELIRLKVPYLQQERCLAIIRPCPELHPHVRINR